MPTHSSFYPHKWAAFKASFSVSLSFFPSLILPLPKLHSEFHWPCDQQTAGQMMRCVSLEVLERLVIWPTFVMHSSLDVSFLKANANGLETWTLSEHPPPTKQLLEKAAWLQDSRPLLAWLPLLKLYNASNAEVYWDSVFSGLLCLQILLFHHAFSPIKPIHMNTRGILHQQV